ncbi:MAG: cytochrome P450 [Acidimicrobiia bacterium]
MSDDAPKYGARVASIADDLPVIMSEHPQQYHFAKLAEGIEPTGEQLVTVRRMADVVALTRSKAVRQFGVGAIEDQMRSGGAGGLGLGGHYTAVPLELNGALHTQWRKILDPVFAPRNVNGLEPRIRQNAHEFIDAFIDRGEADAYHEWCEPLPSSVFLAIMGIPQSEREHFLAFKNVIITGGNPLNPPSIEQRDAAFSDCEAWFAAEFDRREKSGEYGDDIIGWLLQVEVDGRKINRAELHGICNLLMIAGLDTVAASLSCILAHLARHPERRDALLAEPALWPSAIEEMMRYESPVAQGFRHVVEDVELPSGTLKAGTNAIVWWTAANLDPEAFDDPLDVRLDRTPNPNICFASGWHRCLGSHLARMEIRAALDVWHERIPQYRVADGVELTYSVNPRAPHHLPLVW